MKGFVAICVFVVGTLALFTYLLISVAEKERVACAARDGVLVRSANGYQCIKRDAVVVL